VSTVSPLLSAIPGVVPLAASTARTVFMWAVVVVGLAVIALGIRAHRRRSRDD